MRSAALATVVLALASACTSEAAAVTRASSHAQRHLPAFARFDRWARRVSAGDAVARDDAALSELLFAPARNAPDLTAVFVELEGRPARALSLPARAELGAVREWVALRDPALGTIHAAVEPDCPIEGAAPLRKPRAGPCVLITNRLTNPDRPIAITIAFRDAEP